MMHRVTLIAIVVVLFVAALFPSAADAIVLNTSYPTLRGIDLAQPESQTIPNLIAWIYYFAIALGAFLAVVKIAFGGFKYVMAFGRSDVASEGKGHITDAIYGFVLLLIAVIALNFINPDILQQFETGLNIPQAATTPFDEAIVLSTSFVCVVPSSPPSRAGGCFSSIDACSSFCATTNPPGSCTQASTQTCPE